MKLTIAIPTYNRPVQLKNLLKNLLPQLTEECFLLIIDNSSTIPVIEMVKEIVSDYPEIHFEVKRNHVNIGRDSNIIRCFEYCETEWLWTLGDDDEIFENAIETIFSDVNSNPNVVSINYCSPSFNRPDRTNTYVNCGKEEFLINTDSFGSMIYISCNVYQMKHLNGFHFLANNNTYSCVTQWIILFQSLKPDSITIISNKKICHNPFIPMGMDTQNIEVAQGVSTLLDLQITMSQKKLLIDCLKRDINQLVSLESAFRTVLLKYCETNDSNWIFIFKKLYNSYYCYFGLKYRLLFHLYYTCCYLFPKLTFLLITILYKKRNKKRHMK